MLAVSFLTLFLYPLAGEKWDEIKEKLAIIHVEKEKQILAAKGIKFEE